MSNIQFRISDNDPYVYIEPTLSGSVAVGTDAADSNKLKIVSSNAVSDLDPSSGTASISIDPTANGDIEFSPKGVGQSTFLNGDVEISAGNLLMQNTAVGGTEGVIEFGGNRFVHNFGIQNTFSGQNAGNFSLTSGLANGLTAVGFQAMDNVTTGTANTAVGATSCSATTGSSNTCIGYSSLRDVAAGSNNTAVGWFSLGTNTGSNNTAVGYNSGTQYTTTESSNIVIGNTGTITENNTIRIGTQGAGAGQQNKAFIAGINGTSVTAAGTVVVSSSGQLGTSSSFSTTWNDVTGTSASMAVNNGYVADNAGLVTLTLPATAVFGSRLEIVGKGSGGWTIAQNAGQTIHFESLNTTVGVGGSLSSTVRYDCVELICVTANTDFVVKSSVGNITVV